LLISEVANSFGRIEDNGFWRHLACHLKTRLECRETGHERHAHKLDARCSIGQLAPEWLRCVVFSLQLLSRSRRDSGDWV